MLVFIRWSFGQRFRNDTHQTELRRRDGDKMGPPAPPLPVRRGRKLRRDSTDLDRRFLAQQSRAFSILAGVVFSTIFPHLLYTCPIVTLIATAT